MAQLPFVKMQGLGNDFIVIDDSGASPVAREELGSEKAKQLCDRRFGIGADQILWLKRPQDRHLDVRMEIWNADGSSAEMCGNGIRAVALYLRKYRNSIQRDYRVETRGGVKTVQLLDDSVRVDMGCPTLGGGFSSAGVHPGETLELEGQSFRFFEVNVGNPHAVLFVEDVKETPVEKWGPLLETHRRFPNRTNVEFVEIRGSHSIRVRVWERGAGITLACGTGACAAAIASIATGQVQSPADVELPGGLLRVRWDAKLDSPVWMEGPAKEVYRGVIEF